MTIYLWDMSHYDAINGDTAEQVIAQGFAGVTHKAGGDANDAELGAFWSEFKGHRDKLLLGAYWVLLPGNPVGRANAFCDRLDAVCPGWGDAEFILQVDCEEWSGDSGTVPSKAEIKAFCDRLRVRAPKLMPIVYAPKWVYQNSLSGLGYPLWASAYVSGSGTASGLYPGDSSSKWDIYSGQVPAILQFTSSAKIAGQTTCDANAYRGTLAQLKALLAPGWEEEDMAFTADDLATMMNTDGVIAAPAGSVNADGTPNPYWALASYIKDTNAKIRQLQTSVAALGGVDEDALAEALIEHGLTGGASKADVKAALVEVLHTTTAS